MAVQAPPTSNPSVFHLPVIAHAQVTATQADEAVVIVPEDCTVIYGIPTQGVIGGAGGDLSFQVENGTTDIFNTTIQASLAGARVVTEVAPLAAQADLDKGDVLHLDSAITNGTSPTFDGAGVILVCTRR